MSELAQPLDFEIDLLRTGDANAGFRIQNRPGELQRQHLVERDVKPGFSIQGNLIKVIHGHFKPGEDPATVVVVEFRFLAFGSEARRFRQATIELLFADPYGQDMGFVHDPEVVRISPEGKNSLNPTQEKHHVKRAGNIAGDVGNIFPGKLGAGISWEINKSFDREHRASVNGAIRIEGRNHGTKNQAKWGLFENQNSRDGIPSLLRSAILLKRKDDTRFTATIKVEVKVDTLYSVKSKWQSLMGKTPKDDPVVFDPRLEPGDVPFGMDTENLSAYDLTELASVVSYTAVDKHK